MYKSRNKQQQLHITSSYSLKAPAKTGAPPFLNFGMFDSYIITFGCHDSAELLSAIY